MQDAIERLRSNITSVFLGNRGAVDRVICALLARGHILIEDVPGVGKTILATALARSVHCSFSRIQLTPDLLPADILGVTIYKRDDHTFEFKKGPIFANIVLADEINRSPPRTQTALLEAMNEAAVTVDGVVHRLAQPFMIIATQNPYEFEGTYLLPENQLDRFLMRIKLGYPSAEDEARVLDLRPADRPLHDLAPVMHEDEVVALQKRIDAVKMERTLIDYIIALAHATRASPDIQVGLSPRGSLALAQASRATAVLHGRDYVIPEDVLSNILPVCAHRVVLRDSHLSPATAEGAESLLGALIQKVPSPA